MREVGDRSSVFARRLVPPAVLIAALIGWCGTARAAEGDPPDARVDYGALREMSLEDLMAQEVTSVAGVGQEWFKSPAAIYVITHEELRRSGHRSIAEALRMVPGVTVLRGDSNTWSIGARGFNTVFANKLLVRIDGRTTYDLLFSGTFWDVQDVLLEDLDRIEVIRGPGATLWGANAVNGVVNVTTRSAKNTQGLYVGGGLGTYERNFGEARYGFQIDESSWMRVWGKWFDRSHFELPGPGDAHDEWDMARGGLRYDREGDDHAFLTVTAQTYSSGRIGEMLATPPFRFDGRAEGGHALFRFGQEAPGSDGWAVQGYYDRTVRSISGGLQVDRDTVDLEFRHHFKWGERHETAWGAGYRHTADRIEPFITPIRTLTYDPLERDDQTVSAFVQDTITLYPETLFFMIGSKFEHNNYTGFEFQPGGRLWWTPDDDQTLWAAISRPVRTPSRTDEDLIATNPALMFEGSPNVDSEELLAYEAGYRRRFGDDVTVATSLFFNDYHNLISTETLAPGPPAVLTFANHGEARSYGAEVSATWRVAPNWTLRGSYSVIEIDEQPPATDAPEGSTPQQQAQLRSTLDIAENLEFNAAVYYVDQIPRIDVDDYLRLDLGVTWRVNDNFELSIWGQNLLDPAHPEAARGNEFVRGAYLMAVFRY